MPSEMMVIQKIKERQSAFAGWWGEVWILGLISHEARNYI